MNLTSWIKLSEKSESLGFYKEAALVDKFVLNRTAQFTAPLFDLAGDAVVNQFGHLLLNPEDKRVEKVQQKLQNTGWM
jgi:hypothetical protein